MSKDFVVFDAKGLGVIPPVDNILGWVDSFVGLGMECQQDSATSSISHLLNWATEKYGANVSEESIWTCWPPVLLTDGRHCTFNIGVSADTMTFMMLLFEQCKMLELLLIDPSGKNPLITIPGGGGLLD